MKPDVETAADKALNVAHLAALKRILAKNPNQDRADEIRQLIEKLGKEPNAKP